MTITLENYKTVLKDLLDVGARLTRDDEIIFKINNEEFYYRPASNYLNNREGYNDIIFKQLGLNARDFCTKVYGHQAGSGCFPESKSDFYRNIIKITYALFNECEKFQKSIVKLNIQPFAEKSFLSGIEEDPYVRSSMKLVKKRNPQAYINFLEDFIANDVLIALNEAVHIGMEHPVEPIFAERNERPVNHLNELPW